MRRDRKHSSRHSIFEPVTELIQRHNARRRSCHTMGCRLPNSVVRFGRHWAAVTDSWEVPMITRVVTRAGAQKQ